MTSTDTESKLRAALQACVDAHKTGRYEPAQAAAENTKNMGDIASSSSGFLGVYWNSRTSKWRSKIESEGRQYHLGYFHCLKRAIDARRRAEIEHGFFPEHGKPTGSMQNTDQEDLPL